MMKDPATFNAWLAAAIRFAKRGMGEGAEADELQRLWERVQSEGFTVAECLAALEEALNEQRV